MTNLSTVEYTLYRWSRNIYAHNVSKRFHKDAQACTGICVYMYVLVCTLVSLPVLSNCQARTSQVNCRKKYLWSCYWYLTAKLHNINSDVMLPFGAVCESAASAKVIISVRCKIKIARNRQSGQRDKQNKRRACRSTNTNRKTLSYLSSSFQSLEWVQKQIWYFLSVLDPGCTLSLS